MFNFCRKYSSSLLIAVLLGLNVFLLLHVFKFEFNTSSSSLSVSGDSLSAKINKDLSDFQSNNFEGFKDLSLYFTTVAERDGAAYAFELLKVVPLPPSVDTHLLGHVVGDVLYKQEGVDGMHTCTPDFRNACSHTIVVGLLLDEGESALSTMANACKNAPGGPGAYTMCFHGLGHGVLAYNGYDLSKAAKMCQKIGTAEFNNKESSECVGGAIMEMISGGSHDTQAWEREKPNYLSDANPLMPCSLDIIHREAKYLCYTYLTPHLFEVAGGSLSRPDEASIEKAFTFCDAIDRNEVSDRRACFTGFGKEFIVLAKERDIRNMNTFSTNELQSVYSWCNLARTKEGIEYCIEGAVTSLFWGGENNPQVSVDFCSLAVDEYKDSCFNDLLGNARQYLRSEGVSSNFCELLPLSYKETCLQRLQ